MASKTSLNSIDEKIKKLQDRKKTLQEKQEKEIGIYLLKSWDINSLDAKSIFKLIDMNKPFNVDTLPNTNDKPSTPPLQA